MPYRAPNAYARFVKTAGAVNSPGSTRVMGLIGTGLTYYEVYNEVVIKSDKQYDKLQNPNVSEIISISPKPVLFGKPSAANMPYVSYSLKDGVNIVWDALESEGPQVIANFVEPDNATFAEDGTSSYLIEDGTWKIEIDNLENGIYKIFKGQLDSEGQFVNGMEIGEYEFENTVKDIPGTILIINDASALGQDKGDGVVVQTKPAKLSKPARFELLKQNGDVDETKLNNRLSALTVSDASKIVNNALYRVEVQVNNGNKKLNVYNISDISEPGGNFIGTTNNIGERELVNWIPGLEFYFESLEDFGAFTAFFIKAHGPVGNVPDKNTAYYVSYKYNKPDEDFLPKIFFDYDEVIAEYGNYEVAVNGKVTNSLTLGAEIAFQNGITPIVCVQARSDNDYYIKEAIDLLRKTLPGVDNVNTIIPLTESAEVGKYAKAHVELMSSPEFGKERMTYLGASRKQPITKASTQISSSIGMVETAKSYAAERVVFVTPGEVIREVKDLQTGKIYDRKLPACYLAIAVAALGLRNDPAEPLTNKTVIGFKGLTDLYTESEKNFLAEAGCLIVEQSGSNMKVRHGITTSTVDVDSAEITLVQIKDYVIDACRKATAQLYIGNKNKPSIVSDVQYTISSILNQFIAQEIILGHNGLSVKRSKEDPRQIDVNFEIEAVYPLNYINITFGFMAVS